jgi:hypothetical protein
VREGQARGAAGGSTSIELGLTVAPANQLAGHKHLRHRPDARARLQSLLDGRALATHSVQLDDCSGDLERVGEERFGAGAVGAVGLAEDGDLVRVDVGLDGVLLE